MNSSLNESKQNAIELKRSLLDLNLKPFEYAIDRIKEALEKATSDLNLKEASGTMYGRESATKITVSLRHET